MRFGPVESSKVYEMEGVKIPEHENIDLPIITQLKENQQVFDSKLKQHIGTNSLAQYLKRHISLSPGDFTKELHLNKLNIIFSFTSHFTNRFVLLVLLKKMFINPSDSDISKLVF